MLKVLNFSEFLMTKLCHDFAGPIGAIHNGLEFLNENIGADMNAKAMEIIAANSDEMTIKLKFFRCIYGRNGSEGEVDINEIIHIAVDYLKLRKINLRIKNEHEGINYIQLTQRAGKLLLVLAYISVDALIFGGSIEIDLKKIENGKSLKIACNSDKVKYVEDIEKILNNKDQRDLKLSNVHYHLAAQLAAELNVKVKTEFTDNSLCFSYELI